MKKIIYRILVVLALLLPLFIVSIVLLFFGIIQDYVYLKINNDNKEDIISLLQEQEENMFNLDEKIDLNTCYKSLKKLKWFICFQMEKIMYFIVKKIK